MWRWAQKMLSLAKHPLRKQTACSDTIEGSSGSFPSFQNPPSAPNLEFQPYPRREGQDVQQLWGRFAHYLPCVQKITLATNRFHFG
jgi:hypothetical protein